MIRDHKINTVPFFSPLADALKTSLMLDVTFKNIAMQMRFVKDNSSRSFEAKKHIFISLYVDI